MEVLFKAVSEEHFRSSECDASRRGLLLATFIVAALTLFVVSGGAPPTASAQVTEEPDVRVEAGPERDGEVQSTVGSATGDLDVSSSATPSTPPIDMTVTPDPGTIEVDEHSSPGALEEPAPEVVTEADPGTTDDGAAPAPPVPDPEPLEASPAVTVESWRSQIDSLIAKLRINERARREADALYWVLSDALWRLREEVHTALHEDTPDFITHDAQLKGVYGQRIRLFKIISDELRDELTASGPRGRRELAQELKYLSRSLETQVAMLRDAGRMREGVTESPLEAVWGIVRILIAILVLKVMAQLGQDRSPACSQSAAGRAPS